ncbi:hypothetical protein TTRE_0000327301 [Trichuris trichiura]|uniref:Uncharacterized protein n=1 Tax=Trichuris trichiura TaxID=36087 RepID=A0A077Z3B5_TRITR|nr:hypothetical protein TTRE_0000327301 [Trichuris trichiura]
MELSSILQEQESYKHRVDEAQDLDELHAIQRELQRLTQRQLELTDEQAELTMYCSVRERTAVKEEPYVEVETSEAEDIRQRPRNSRSPAVRRNHHHLASSSDYQIYRCIFLFMYVYILATFAPRHHSTMSTWQACLQWIHSIGNQLG